MSGIALFLYYYKQFYYDIPTPEHRELLPATKFAPLIFLLSKIGNTLTVNKNSVGQI